MLILLSYLFSSFEWSFRSIRFLSFSLSLLLVKNIRTTGIFVSDSKRLLLRIAQTLIISIIAWFLPNFGDIVSLVGGFVFTAISLVIPPFLHVKCNDITKGQKVLDTVGCIIFTAFMLVSTVFSAIVLIQNSK